MDQTQQTKVKMDPVEAQRMISNAEDITCPCGGYIFSQGLVMKKVSSLDPGNPTGQNQVINIPVTYCVKCGEQFLPPN